MVDEVTGPRSDEDASNTLWMERILSTGFVGRDRERRTLVQAWAAAAAGSRRFALIEGEPGIGKTAVAAAVAHHATVDGGLVLYGRWDEDFVAPFQAIREALAAYAHACPPSVLQNDLRHTGGEIARLFPDVVRSIDIEPSVTTTRTEVERLRLFEALDGWLGALASRRPACLVLDDLQWADEQSFRFLLHLLHVPVAIPLFVVATVRDVSLVDGDPVSLVQELARHPNVDRVQLGGLGRADIADLVEHVSGYPLAEGARGLAELLRTETGGNPLFLRELIDHLSGLGSLNETSRRDITIPESVRDLVRWRLGPLQPHSREALEVASLIGHVFEADLLARATGIDLKIVTDAVGESRRAGLIYPADDEGTRFAFAHELVRRTLLDELSAARRTTVHQHIADALEEIRPGTSPAELAYHLCAGVDAARAEKAIAYARVAASDAIRELAYEAAIAHLHRALEIQESLCPEGLTMRCELMIALGEAHDRAGHYVERDERLREAGDLARQLGRHDLFAGAALRYGGVLPAATEPDPEGQAFLEEALERLPSGDSRQRAHVLGRLAHSLQLVPPRSRRVALADEAVEMARRLGDPADLAATLIYRCWALDGPDDLMDQFTTAAEIRSLGEKVDDSSIVLRALHLRSDALFEAGDMSALLSTLTEMSELAYALRWPEYIRIVRAWDAVFAAIEGRYDDAHRIASEVRSLLEQMGHQQTEIVYQGLLVTMRWMRGELIEGLEVYELLAAAMPERIVFPTVIAWATAEAGMDDKAKAALDAIDPDAIRELDHNFTWWGVMVGLTNAVTLLGDRKRAAVLYDLLLPFTGRNASMGSSSFAGSVRHYVGALAATLGRDAEATAHLEVALRRHEAMGARAFVALTQAVLAGVVPDASRAADLRRTALDAASELGLRAVERRTWV